MFGERLVCPLLLIGLGRRSWSRRWTRVSTVIGGHSVAGIDAASAQVPPLERRGEALDLPGDKGARRVGSAGGAATCAERQPDLQVAEGSAVRTSGCGRGGAGVLAGRDPWRRGASGVDGVACSRRLWAGRNRPGDGVPAGRRRPVRCGGETAKLNGINPQTWLTDVLGRIAGHKITRSNELLPWRYAAAAA